MSQRNHAAQGGAGGGTHDTSEEMELWNGTQKSLQKVAKNEARLMEIRQQLSRISSMMELQEKSGTRPSIEDIDRLHALYKESSQITENSKSILESDNTVTKVSLLKVMVSRTESSGPRPEAISTSASDMDRSGPILSNPAKNKRAVKFGASSRPPKEEGTKDATGRKKTYSRATTSIPRDPN